MARIRGTKGKGGPLATLQSIGISRGLFGGSKGWLYVGGGLWTVRTIRRMAERKPEILIREEIKPGQRITIANNVATIDGGELPVKRGRRGKLKPRKPAD
ncbi:MAG: hypothetical protein KDB02_12885 [Acidimicrobiales bacterium]|nr:hypothetical protein [Acidimicrobiales bacterium]